MSTVFSRVLLTQRPVRHLLQKFQIVRDGQNVQEMEEDIHHQNSPKVHQSMNGDAPHLSIFTSQVRVVSLRILEGLLQCKPSQSDSINTITIIYSIL